LSPKDFAWQESAEITRQPSNRQLCAGKSFRVKAEKIQNTVDPKSVFDTFRTPRSGKDCRASRSIEELKKFFKNG